jgi:alkanesulfonate monooxygenase SsuD/methylene tetrahydromethanopterin reductase-like flavin-dependent oxidoreductase (luciferase family)
VLSAEQQEATEAYAAFQARGSQQTVARRLADLVSAFDADELMLATSVYDPKDRIRSLELVAELTAAD